MYSIIKSVQLLVALLKEYDIKHVVMSPGGSNIPIVHSIEVDPFFECYSVVDERSAVYFGMGIAQAKNVPVACVCTSGTAVSNFLAGITEAYYRNVPIVAITADKNQLFLNQIETQKIDQTNIFGTVCKKSVDLPIINTDDEYWYCERVISEALLEMSHHGFGPVHINISTIGNTSTYCQTNLPSVKSIRLVDRGADVSVWREYINWLKKAEKILVVVGQDIVFTDRDIKNIEGFFEKYNCAFSVEHMSNLKCAGTLLTYAVTEIYGNNALAEFVPDLVISCGNNIASYELKPFLRQNHKAFKHWSIDEGGRVRDVFQGLTDIFECSASYFFEFFNNNAPTLADNNKKYYFEWKQAVDRIVIPEFKFSNFYVAQQLAKIIPPNAILHLAILNSTRIMQFFNIDKSIRVFSNLGALGIDGCLSTFMGQAVSTSELAFCLIGDLSFFYDMNAVGIGQACNNVRIVLLNNGGGSEFHFFMGRQKIPTIDKYICAEHKKSAKGWVESLGYKYYSASSKAELDEILSVFKLPSLEPLFLEVFSEMEKDANLTKTFYQMNKPASEKVHNVKTAIKTALKSMLTEKQIAEIKRFINKNE